MLAHEVLSSLRGLMLPQALEMRGDGSGTQQQQQQQQQQRDGGGVSPEGDQAAVSGRGGMGLGSLMEACLPRSGAAKEGEFVIDVGSLNLGEEGEDSSEDDDSFLWQSSHGSEMASAGKSRSRHSRREKKWNCYGEDSVSITSSEDCSFISSEASSTGMPSHPSSPFHSYGSHRRTNGAPDPRDVIDYAQFLGIDPVKEPNLLHIAEEGLLAPLPEGWTDHKDAEGNIYYYNAERSCSEWQHPLDAHFRDKVEAARARHAARRERKKQSKRGQQHVTNAVAQARGGAVRSLVLEPSLP